MKPQKPEEVPAFLLPLSDEDAEKLKASLDETIKAMKFEELRQRPKAMMLSCHCPCCLVYR